MNQRSYAAGAKFIRQDKKTDALENRRLMRAQVRKWIMMGYSEQEIISLGRLLFTKGVAYA